MSFIAELQTTTAQAIARNAEQDQERTEARTIQEQREQKALKRWAEANLPRVKALLLERANFGEHQAEIRRKDFKDRTKNNKILLDAGFLMFSYNGFAWPLKQMAKVLAASLNKGAKKDNLIRVEAKYDLRTGANKNSTLLDDHHFSFKFSWNPPNREP